MPLPSKAYLALHAERSPRGNTRLTSHNPRAGPGTDRSAPSVATGPSAARRLDADLVLDAEPELTRVIETTTSTPLSPIASAPLASLYS